MRFVGHVVSGEGISVDPKKIKVVVDWPSPTMVVEFIVFLAWLAITEDL